MRGDSCLYEGSVVSMRGSCWYEGQLFVGQFFFMRGQFLCLSGSFLFEGAFFCMRGQLFV